MEKRIVYHPNMIGHEINESLELYSDDVLDREVYCRKLHVVKEPLQTDCIGCPFYAGLEQGYGHECAWEDVADQEHFVQHEDRYKEYERVDKLMKRGILETVANDLILKVKIMDYDEKKWVYEQSTDLKNRYLLGKKGRKTLICCGVNPSYASPEHLDPTMKKVEYFAEQNGYDSYVMINLYPMRATEPKRLHKTKDKSIIKHNYQTIEKLLMQGHCDIWAAWGTLIEERTYLQECLAQIVELADKYDCTWYRIGNTTKAGHPRHPLFVSKSEKTMEHFDVHTYLRVLETR